MSTLVCPKCNYKAEGNEQFCCKCGTMLAVVPEKAFCSSCGAELKPDAEFCSQCGTKRNAASRTSDYATNTNFISGLEKESLPHNFGVESNSIDFCSREGTARTEHENESISLAGPWSRLIARTIDLFIEMTVASAFFHFVLDCLAFSIPATLGMIICTPFCFILDSIVYTLFGNTLGKWLLGVRIVDKKGIVINPDTYFSRNWKVYFSGCALGVPFLGYITMMRQYIHFSKTQSASYDEEPGLKVVNHNKMWLKAAIGVILFIGIATFEFLLNANSLFLLVFEEPLFNWL